MKKIVVRRARSEDAARVAEIARREFAAGWSVEAYAAEAERPESIFLVAEDDAVRGYAVARLTGDELCLLDFAVDEDGCGVGKALWTAMCVDARDAVKMTLEVSARNERAVVFYERAGAKRTGRRPRFYPDGDDALLFDLNLR